MKVLAIVGTGLGMIVAMSSSAVAQRGAPPEPAGAKALFYGQSGATVPSSTPAARNRPPQIAGNHMGVRYWVELQDRAGRLTRVTTDHRFRAGDRIKLYVQSNRDGYLYLVNQGTTGRSTMLFPAAGMPAGSNAIRANAVYEVPPASYLVFDQNPGEERVMLLFSAVPLDGGPAAGGTDVASLSPPPSPSPSNPQWSTPGAVASAPTAGAGASPPVAPGFPGPATGTPLPPAPDPQAGAPSPQGTLPSPTYPPPATTAGTAASTGTFQVPGAPQPAGLQSGSADGSRLVRDALAKSAGAKGAKDLVVETDRGPQPASYAVTPASTFQNGGVITIEIRLRHS